jgi:hypothetical protein
MYLEDSAPAWAVEQPLSPQSFLQWQSIVSIPRGSVEEFLFGNCLLLFKRLE